MLSMLEEIYRDVILLVKHHAETAKSVIYEVWWFAKLHW